MSGQMSSSEIEDMLSSVRRLVSEDFRPTPKPQIVSKMVVEDKLILTPALRVVSSSFAAKPMQGAAVQVAQSQDMSVPASPVGVASVQSAAVQINPVRVASDQAASVPNLSEEVASVQASSGSAVPIEAGLAQTPSTAPRPAVGPLPRLHLGAELEIAPTTPNVVATLSQAVDRQSGLDWDAETGDPEPDISALDWSSFTFARRSMQESWIARTAAIKAIEPVAEAPVAGAPVAVTPEVIGQGGDPDHIVFHEQRQDDVWQDDDAAGLLDGAGAVFAEDDSDWADAADAEVIASLDQLDAQNLDAQKPDMQAPEATTSAEVLPGVAQEEDNIFSEQVLRELVRDLIREQLQGDLGERITRNIRKLVKAEIARALAVHALE
jgi:hypothetical protein